MMILLIDLNGGWQLPCRFERDEVMFFAILICVASEAILHDKTTNYVACKHGHPNFATAGVRMERTAMDR
jgi:hypothetical protein